MNMIRPVSDLRNNFADISKTVHETAKPVFLTKNGYGDMVVLSMEAYENLYGHLGQGSLDISEDTPPINPRPFWRYALRNVLTGYLLREYDKRKMNAK